jgi:hypothetical protein
MSIKVTLYVDDKEFRVLDFFFGFFQNSDYTGRPTSSPNAHPFKFVIEASKDITFVEWAMHATMMRKRCKIVFSPVNGMSKSTTIELLDVYCIFCKYNFTATGSEPLTVSFDLSPATIIRNGQVLLSRHWKVTDPEMLNVQPTLRETEDNEPKVIDYYISDLEGNKNPKYKVGDYIYVVVITKNMIGKELTMNLANKTKDFKYKDKLLPNDKLENYPIGSNRERIKLEVVEQQKTSK